MSNMLTTKEVMLLGDLLSVEEAAARKARLYSNAITDPELSNRFSEIAKEHEGRFCSLFSLL